MLYDAFLIPEGFSSCHAELCGFTEVEFYGSARDQPGAA